MAETIWISSNVCFGVLTQREGLAVFDSGMTQIFCFCQLCFAPVYLFLFTCQDWIPLHQPHLVMVKKYHS